MSHRLQAQSADGKYLPRLKLSLSQAGPTPKGKL